MLRVIIVISQIMTYQGTLHITVVELPLLEIMLYSLTTILPLTKLIIMKKILFTVLEVE